MGRGLRGRRHICTSLEASPVVALTELLWALSTCGGCRSQSFCSSSPTVVSMRAIV